MNYLHLYFTVVKISALGVGGAYSIWALLERQFVTACPPLIETAAKICADDFKTALSLAEIIPGPQVNAMGLLFVKHWGIGGFTVVLLALITPGILAIPFALRTVKSFDGSSRWKLFMHGAALCAIPILAFFCLNIVRGLMPLKKLTEIGVPFAIISVFFCAYKFHINPFLLTLSAAVLGYFFF